jgi:hypothetical protein
LSDAAWRRMARDTAVRDDRETLALVETAYAVIGETR